MVFGCDLSPSSTAFEPDGQFAALITSDPFKEMFSRYDIGGEGSFFGGEAGESANNTNVVFDVFSNKETGGGKTTMQVQKNDKGEWVDANVAKGSEAGKDSKARISVLVAPEMKGSNS